MGPWRITLPLEGAASPNASVTLALSTDPWTYAQAPPVSGLTYKTPGARTIVLQARGCVCCVFVGVRVRVSVHVRAAVGHVEHATRHKQAGTHAHTCTHIQMHAGPAQVLEGKELSAGDWDGKCDPFVQVRVWAGASIIDVACVGIS